MNLDIVTRAEHDSAIQKLSEKIELLEKFIMPYVQQDKDKQKVLSKEEACKFVMLSESGISDARRKGRIVGIKINAKEYGYRISDLENYIKRYKNGRNKLL